MLRFDDISLEFGDQCIFKQASFSIEPGERLCLIGRNGAGKTTLFKIIMGEIEPDSGELMVSPDLRISELQQTLPRQLHETVYDYVTAGLTGLRVLIDEYHRRSDKQPDDNELRELATLQHQIEAGGGWNIDIQVQTILTELELPAERKIGELSGGWQRRAALAKALISQPQLLLLDEPTNHLDLSAIRWIEDKAFGFTGSILFITHDRAFLQRLATGILELDRGKLTSWPGNYRKFLIEKERVLAEEARNNAVFDKHLAREEAWIRQGIKARRTRNEGRVRALIAMREEYARRVKPQAGPRISLEQAEQSGRKVIEARNISHGYGGKILIQGLSLKIQRGDRIGLIGNNGVGKSTLLRLLLGEMTPQKGTVKLGANLEIGHFEQHRERLNPEKTVAEIVGDGSDYVKVNGRDRHVIGYLRGFLFSPRRAMTKVKVLSGGECNRLILARLFIRPSNLLVLDEPTNDLDVETLEVLEQRLCQYEGTLIVVSHDREFLDNVVTSTLVFEAGGKIQSYAGGYSDWLKQGQNLNEADNPNADKQQGIRSNSKAGKKTGQGKLSYKLKLELEQLPSSIETIENEISQLQRQIQENNFYNQGYEITQPILDRLAEQEKLLEQKLTRWEELEAMQTNLESESL